MPPRIHPAANRDEMNDQFLSAVSQYGAPALFGIVTIAAIGVRLPIGLLLIVACECQALGTDEQSPYRARGSSPFPRGR